MVQKALIILLFLLPSISRADINLEFSDITIPEFAQTVLKGIIKQNYVISPEVLADGRKLTISIKHATEAQLIPLVTELLHQNGIELVQRSGFLYLSKQQSVQPLPQASAEQQPEPIAREGQAASGVPAQAVPPEVVDLPIYSYRPRYREIKEITDLLVFAGATVSQAPTQDVIFYKAEEETQIFLLGLLDELDKPANEVIVKAFIYEVTNNARDVNAFTAAVSLLNGKLGLGISGPVYDNSLSLKLADAELVISAFNTDNRFKQVSAPSLRVKNGKNSRFTVGTETPVIVSTSQTNSGNPVQSVAYRSSGVILDITPRIYDDIVELDILQEISSFVPTTNGVNNTPTLIKREIRTTVNTGQGELIILGGLDEKRTSKQKTGFKFLPDFLQNHDDQENQSDILLVMQVQRL